MYWPDETGSRETESLGAAMSDRLRALVAETRLVAEALMERRLVDKRHAFALAWLVGVLVFAGGVQPADASQLIDRNATAVKLVVDANGEAMLTYTAGGTVKHLLAWGAVNAIPPTRSRKQTTFSLDYSGGWGRHHVTNYWERAPWVCLPYDGPPLAWKVSACKAPDGSYWAVQSWQRGLPDLGATPSPAQAVWELHLSHWTGATPILDIKLDWSYRKFAHLFGTYTYGGLGEYGFQSTETGVPLDSYGRNIYVDTFDSAYGAGWKRENSFLTHGPKGTFCYGLYPHGNRPSGAGTKYRATVIGPGVAPDVMWEGTSPGPYDPNADAAANAVQKTLGDPHCQVN